MKRTTGLLLLLPLLLLVESSCSGSPSQRHLVEFPQIDGPPLQCFEPLQAVIVKGEKANLELTANRLETLLRATGGVGLNVERIRQELPADVSSFEVIEFRICAQYGNGVLSKDEYRAFTTQIIPAYKKNPPEKPVLDAGTTASAQQVEACGPSFTTKRLAAKFVPNWVSHINRLRKERNTHDLQNLFEVWGRIPVGLTGKDLIHEATFTLNCMEQAGELKLATLGATGRYWGVNFENQMIIFRNP
jgi:hypothetical protein